MATVLLARSPQGLLEAIRINSATGSPVWCGSDAISEQDFASLAQPPSVSRFNYPLLDQSEDTLASALSTIEEHHPGATIWVEHRQPTG